ncbi:MAG TPA: dephospho-CoA kinase [Phycisphaerae bacterium]|nr:dephospho-CoA kinase [Phycisphaerae bacterium]
MANPKSGIPNPKSPPPVIGLVGGIGAGKSLVAAQLAQLGCAVVDADRIAHEVLAEPAVRQAVRDRFGGEVFDAAGEVDRGRLAERVFADADSRRALEALVHPEICCRARQAVEAARAGGARAVVLDAALILEKGLDSLCDVVLYIKVPAQVRQRRVEGARGWAPSEIARREAFQVSLKTKQQRADYTVDNSASPEHTCEQIRAILLRIAP